MRISDWSSDVCSSDLATPLAITLLPGGSVSDWAEEYIRTPGRFIPDNLITMPGLEQGPLATLRSCNCTDFDLAAARGAGYRLIDDGRGGHGRSVTMGGAKSKIMGAAGARSEEHTSELQSLMRISYAVFCLK